MEQEELYLFDIPLIRWTVATFLAVLLIGLFTLSNAVVLVFGGDYLEDEFDSLNISEETGIPQEELIRVNGIIQEYLRLERENIDYKVEMDGSRQRIYTEEELVYMQDVREVFQDGFRLLGGSVFLIILSLIGLWRIVRHRDNRISIILTTIIQAFLVAVPLMAVIGLIGFFGYDELAAQFGERILNSEVVLDPNEHVLAAFYPPELIRNAVLAVMGRSLLYMALVGVTFWTMRFARGRMEERSKQASYHKRAKDQQSNKKGKKKRQK